MKWSQVLLVLIFLTCFAQKYSWAGRCTGSAYCTACSNCSRCKHCSNGGTCGVCEGRRTNTFRHNQPVESVYDEPKEPRKSKRKRKKHRSHTSEEEVNNQISSKYPTRDGEVNYFSQPEKDTCVSGWMIAFFALLGYMALKMFNGKHKI